MTPRINIEDMTDAQDEALMPCPFCGTTEMLRRVGARDGDGWGFVRCDYCDAEGPDPDNLKGHWNTRADLARPSQAGDDSVARLIEAVRGLLHYEIAHVGPYAVLRVAEVRAALAAMDTPKGGGDA